jgi:hypothetical protein
MAAPTPSKPRWTLARWVDSLGSVGALLCAVHCALLPFALALLPVIGLGIFASTAFETSFVLFATALAIASLWHGYRGHRAYHAFAVLLPGLVALWTGILVPALHHARLPHAVAMSIGGTLVAIAHLVNLRLSRGHTHDHAHAHGDAHGHGGHAHGAVHAAPPVSMHGHAGHAGEARIPPPADAA